MDKNKGFSLIELMIAISMIGILIAVVTPNMQKWIDNQRAGSSADTIRSLFELAKMEAIKNQANVAVRFTTGTGSAGSYIVFLDNGATPESFDAGERTVSQGSVEKDITLLSAVFPGTTNTNVAVFNQMGLASNSAGTVSISNAAGDLFKQVQLSNSGVARTLSSPTGADGSWK